MVKIVAGSDILGGDQIRNEILRLKTIYREKDSSSEYLRQYRAFEPLECGYRCQQIRCLSDMLYSKGYRDLSGLRILDVGCGTGRLLGDFIGMGGNSESMFGVDIMLSRLVKAIDRYPSMNFILIDGADLPFESISFDLLVQSVVFSSIGLPGLRKKLAAEMVRVTKPGGFIWWWDMVQTLPEAGNQSITLNELFPNLPILSKQISWLPLPSNGIAKKRWKWALSWLIDLFAPNPTHLVALIGPKKY